MDRAQLRAIDFAKRSILAAKKALSNHSMDINEGCYDDAAGDIRAASQAIAVALIALDELSIPSGNSGVYFIQVGDNGPIKIGFSDDVSKRLAGLQTANAEELRLRLVIDTAPDQETTFHIKFAAHRLRGEWFAPALEILNFIAGVQGFKP